MSGPDNLEYIDALKEVERLEHRYKPMYFWVGLVFTLVGAITIIWYFWKIYGPSVLVPPAAILLGAGLKLMVYGLPGIIKLLGNQPILRRLSHNTALYSDRD